MIAILFIFFERSQLIMVNSHVTSMACSFIVIIILHIFIQPETLNSLNCAKYLYTHSTDFKQTFLPLMICLMKLSVAISVEILSISCSFAIDDELYIVMNYICLLCIM